MLQAHFKWLASASPRGRTGLERKAKATLREFFRYRDIGDVHLQIQAITPGGNHQALIRVVPHGTEFSLQDKGLPVKVNTHGTQALTGLLHVEGLDTTHLKRIIEDGPYNRKASMDADSEKSQPEILPEPSPHSVEIVGETPVETVVEVTAPETSTVVYPHVHPTKRLTPRERLVKGGLADDELKRLEATLATILYREVHERGETEVPCLMQVSVKKITQAILEHMQLPQNSEGNYRGIIGSFFANRIRLFAEKLNETTDAGDLYTDWFFDCDLVLDFVGGKDQLEHLSMEREREVQTRIEREAQHQGPPLVASKVEEAVNEGSLNDYSIFDLAMRTLSQRSVAEHELELAQINANNLHAEVQALEERLSSARSQLLAAQELVGFAENKLLQYQLSDEVLQKIRNAKSRIDELASKLGL